MPFTLAHTICAIPFYKKRWFSISAMTLGLMAPDLSYFVLFQGSSDISTKFPSVLWFTLPISALIWWTWDAIIAPHLYENYAPKLPKRSQKPENYRILWLMASFFIGMAMHLFVDSFAEPDGFWVEMFPTFFDQEILTVQVTTWMQYGISFSGTILLVLFLIIWWFRQPKLESDDRWVLAKEVAIVLSMAIVLSAVSIFLIPIGTRSLIKFIPFTIVRLVSTGYLSLLLYILYVNWQETGYLLAEQED